VYSLPGPYDNKGYADTRYIVGAQMALCIEHGWKSPVLVTAPWHMARAHATMLGGGFNNVLIPVWIGSAYDHEEYFNERPALGSPWEIRARERMSWVLYKVLGFI
jgi:uncharacterized SAM-binding protein YcdF (DUF218 family)